jgi:hypothetical protein
MIDELIVIWYEIWSNMTCLTTKAHSMDIFTGICDIEHEHLIAVPYGYHMSSIRAYSNFLK